MEKSLLVKSHAKSVKSLGKMQWIQNPYTLLGVGDPLSTYG